MSILEDGRGNSFKAGVNKEGEVKTFSQIIRQRDLKSLQAKTFFTFTGSINITGDTGGTPVPIFDFLNGTQQRIVMSSIFYSWNKLTSTQINIAAISAIATGANTAIPIINNENGNLTVPTDIDFQKWDGTGSGMTYAISPFYSHFYSLSRENSPYLLEVYNIWNPASGASVAINAEEAGVFTLIFTFHLEDLLAA